MRMVTAGLVLREVKVRESDRILTLLTPEGVVSAVAKGSLRLKSKLFSSCGLFCYSEFTLFAGRGSLYTVDDAQSKHVFHGISASVENLSLAIYLAEIVLTLQPAGEEAQRLLRLLLNSFHLISGGKTPLQHIKACFELRAMCESGFRPDLVYCQKCGRYEGGDFYFDAAHAQLLCADCAAQKGKHPNLDATALHAMRHIALVEEKKVFAFSIPPQSQRGLDAVCERYLQQCLDKPLKSYEFLKSVLPEPEEPQNAPAPGE